MHTSKFSIAAVIIILILSCTVVKGQYFTKEKILYLMSSVAYPVLEGYVEGLQEREKLTHNTSERLMINRRWHQWKIYEEGSAIVAGLAISFDSEFNVWKILSNLFLSAALYWVIHDEMVNRVNGYNVGFGFSSNSGSGQFMDRISAPYVKIPILGIAFAANVLLFAE